jgi:hypothetical protein
MTDTWDGKAVPPPLVSTPARTSSGLHDQQNAGPPDPRCEDGARNCPQQNGEKDIAPAEVSCGDLSHRKARNTVVGRRHCGRSDPASLIHGECRD